MEKVTNYFNNRHLTILGSILAASLIILVVTQALIASEEAILPPDLSQSTKTVNKVEAPAGSKLQYQINVKNTGNQLAIVSVTDTLPAELTYVPGTLSVPNGGSNFGEAGNVITWTGAVNSLDEVVIHFDAMLADELELDSFVINSADILLQGDDTPVQPNVGTRIIEAPLGAYFPVVFKPLPQVVLNPIVRNSTDNSWTVRWNVPNVSVTRFEIQESQLSTFEGAPIINAGLTTSRAFAHTRSTNNLYYYRVRAVVGDQLGPWSNVRTVAGNFRDDFQNNSGWKQRRTNANSSDVRINFRSDDVLEVSVLDDNRFVLLSPLKPAPQLPAKFEMEAEINGADGSDVEKGFIFSMIFGADWNGGNCATVNTSGCFDNYYRLRFRWNGGSPDMQFRLDWVEGHMSDNRPNNDTLIDWTDIDANVDLDDWIEVDALVEADGDIKIFFMDERVGTVRHSRITNTGFEPYFGLGVSTEGDPDARIKFRYYEAEKAIE